MFTKKNNCVLNLLDPLPKINDVFSIVDDGTVCKSRLVSSP